jgi:solute carrier family 31 (copper transporter), member 1
MVDLHSHMGSGMHMGLALHFPTTSSSSMPGMDMGNTNDILWFKAWAPSSSGAVVGACIGLFLLAILERLVANIRSILDDLWIKE